MSGVLAIMGSKKSSALSVYFYDLTAHDYAYYPANANATFQAQNTGQVIASNNSPFTWLLSGSAGDYEIKAELFSGDSPTSGTLSTWQVLSTTRSWTLSETGGSYLHGVLDMEVRRTSDSVVISTFRVTLNAEVLGL